MNPEFYFLKFKKILAPFEVINKSTDIGWKIRKNYIKWDEVHFSSQSKDILRPLADDLVDKNYLNPSYYHELSGMLSRIQSWALDTENPNYELHTPLIPQYEKFERVIRNGSIRPGMVDQILSDKGFVINDFEEKERWILFVSLEIIDFFKSQKRYEKQFLKLFETNVGKKYKACIELAKKFLSQILGAYCFDEFLLTKSSEEIIETFLTNLGLPSEPEVNDRNDISISTSKPNVIIEYVEVSETIFVKFEIFEGQLILKINNNHLAFKSKNPKYKIYKDKIFWENVGDSIFSNLGKIDAIQTFFTSLGLIISDE